MSQLRTTGLSHKDSAIENITLLSDGKSVAGKATESTDTDLTLATKGYVDANSGGNGGGDGGTGSGADAWGRFNGQGGVGPVTPLGSQNIKSITKVATGVFEVEFQTPMPNANYAITCGSSVVGEQTQGGAQKPTAEGFTLVTVNSLGNVDDAEVVSFAVFATNAIPPKGTTGTDAWGSIAPDGTIKASYNIASVTATAISKAIEYNVVFTTPMPSNDYSVVVSNENTNYQVDLGVTGSTDRGPTVNGFYYYVTSSDAGEDLPGGVGTGVNFVVNATNAQLPETVTQEQIEAAINNPGLSAWGNVNSDGVLQNGLNVTTSKVSEGIYNVVFNTPMPNDQYSVTASPESGVSTFVISRGDSYTTNFQILSRNTAGALVDAAFNFQVAATNALPPRGGTGTDAWGVFSGSDPGTILSSFNINSITRTDVGKYSVVFTNPMPTSGYAVVGSVWNLVADTACTFILQNKTATGFDYVTVRDTGQASDGTVAYSDQAVSFTVNATNAQLPDTVTQEQIDAALSTWKKVGNNLEPVTAGNTANAGKFFADVGTTESDTDTTLTTKGYVDALVAGGGGSGSGADAWGDVVSNGTLNAGQNIDSVVRNSAGVYTITFTTPMPSDKYSVVATQNSPASYGRTAVTGSQTANGFSVYTYDDAQNSTDQPFSFAVFATNATPPKGTTGADAWVNFYGTRLGADPNQNPVVGEPVQIAASYNVDKVFYAGVGSYIVRFTNPMPTGNYAVSGSATLKLASADAAVPRILAPSTRETTTANQVQVYTIDDTGNYENCNMVSVVVHASNANLPQTVTQEQIDAAVNNPGLSAWADIAPDGSLNAASNIASVSIGGSNLYTVTFKTPMPSASYSVTGSVMINNAALLFELAPGAQTANSFSYYLSQGNTLGSTEQARHYVQVAATNALPPKGGTGTDAWGSVNADSSVNASFNVGQVSQTEKWDGTTVTKAAGYYYVKFTTPMPTDQYSVQMSTDSQPNDLNNSWGISGVVFEKSTLGFSYVVRATFGSGTAQDWWMDFTVNATNAQLPNTVTQEQIDSALPPVGATSNAGYQQGTWNPQVGEGGLDYEAAVWTRVGNQVTVWAQLYNFTETSSNNSINILNCPYKATVAVAAGSAFYAYGDVSDDAGGFTTTFISDSDSVPGNTFIQLYAAGSGTFRVMDYANIRQSSFNLYLTASYITADTTWQPINGATVS